MDAVLAALSDGVTVVTANNRLARSIALTWNRHQRAAGRGAWRTPDVLPWHAWLERLWSESLAGAGEAGASTLLNESQARIAWQQVIEAARPETAWGSAGAMAQAAVRAWRLCRAWQVSDEALRESADSDDSALFAAWAGRFRARCEERGWMDPATLADVLARDLDRRLLSVPARLVLAGFDEWSPQQQRFARALEHAGAQVLRAPIPRREHGQVRQVACESTATELETAARWARAAREHAADAVVGVVVPGLARRATAVRRTFLDIVDPDWRSQGEGAAAVNLSFGVPLAQVPLVHVALLALEALHGRLDYRRFGQLLRTPYLAGATQEASGRAWLDLALREQIGTEVDLAAAAARGQSLAPLFSERLAGLLARLQRCPPRQTAGAWADEIAAVLEGFGWPGERVLSSAEYQAVLAWRGLLDNFARTDAVLDRLSLSAALATLQALAREQVFQPEGRPDAIQVLGALEAVGQIFDGLWVCGLTSDEWPPAGRPSALLPLSLQRRLSMPDSSPVMVRERSERLLRHLTGSATEVYLSWPMRADDEPLTPSPLIRGVAPIASTGLAHWSEPSWRQRLAATPALETLAADPAPPVAAEEPMWGGARLLAWQARCPARAFAEMRLGAVELPVPAPGISPAERGLIAHAALERFFQEFPDQDELRRRPASAIGARLTALIGEALRARLPAGSRLVQRMADLERQRLQRILEEFLRAELERPGFSVEAREEDRLERLGGLTLRLRPDRVDRLATGERLVIDYKTGGDFRAGNWLGARLREPQLPLYAVLLGADGVAIVELKGEGVSWHGVAAGGARPAGVKDVAAFCADPDADWPALLRAWRVAMETIAAEFMQGDFRLDLRDPELAQGCWAMLTRIHELDAAYRDGPQ